MKARVVWIVMIAALGGLMFGYNTCVISGAVLFLKNQFSLTTFQEEMVVSVILVGALIGALGGGTVADKIGRKWTIISTAIVFVISGIILAYAPNFQVVMWGRFIGGLAVGVSSLAVPLYIAELSPPKHRGALVTANQLAITIGILFGYLIGYAFADTGNWRWMFGLTIIPGVIQLVGMIFSPESPRWLLTRGKSEKAVHVLKMLRKSGNIDREIEEIRKVAKQKIKEGGWRDLFAPVVLPALFVGVGLSVFQQITGINTVIYYAPQIFEISGFAAPSKAILASIAIGSINVLATIVSLWLLDRVGRRKLLLIGVGGMVISLLFLSLGFFSQHKELFEVSVISLMAYVAFFAIGLGPVAFLIISEIYPLHLRGKAMSLALFANWVCNFIVSLTFLSLIEAMGSGQTFILYAVIGVLAWWFVYRRVPETKGKSLEEIEITTRKKLAK
jgi:sugar porter (SP) family MFS transporter